MGCTTFVTECEAILIQEGKKIEREANWAVDRLIFDNELEQVRIENNVISTAYEMRTFSEFETFTLPTEMELT